MASLTLDLAKQILATTTTQPHLLVHAQAVSAAMGAMARHLGGDEQLWQAVGWLHDVDYERYPDEHLQHTRQLLAPYELDEEVLRAILAHGWGLCTDVEPLTAMERALYAVDELTGLIQATARMRPQGIADLTAASVMKKFKDKKFAAGCSREVIRCGAERLEMPLEQLVEVCIEGMRPYAQALGLAPREGAC